MHQLFVVTPCNYTVAGFKALMAERRLPVRIIPALTTEEVRMTPSEGGNRVIVVVLPAREPAVCVLGRIFLWRRSLQQMAGMSDHALCLVLSDETSEKYIAAWRLHWPLPLPSLTTLLIRALEHPHLFVSRQAEARTLTPMQKAILDATLAGESVRTTAARLVVNLNRTDADRWDINSSAGSKNAAGWEGVTNKDINGVFSWKITPQQILDFEAGYSRQGNIYAGDTQNSSSSAVTKNLAQSGQETNRLYRQNYGLTHNGIWDWGQSRLGFYYEKTNNTRMDEGLSGGGEGRITNDQQFTTNRLTSYRTSGELNFPMRLLFEQTLTVGAEWNRDELDDPSSMGLTAKENNIGGVSGSAANRSSKNKSEISALYVEDNIEPVAGSNIIPGLRFDYLSKSSGNFSPSLNLSQELGEYVKVKAGIARAFKAPNLYQTSEGYLLFSKGNGCPKDITSGGCYLLGNKNLDPEISINKEIGLELAVDDYHASLTYFRNDYQNKIVAGDNVIGKTSSGAYILQWQNGGKALIEGLEASMAIPLEEDRLSWNTNATYMITSEQKDTGNPLSIIPKYTVNTSLDWNITSSISAGINWTLYGKQKPRTHAESRSEDTGGLSGKELGAYSLVGTNVNYDINKNLRLNVGISNIFDKQIYRSTEGANTYNEPGRAYYAGVTASF